MVWEVAGESSAGKTQLALQLSLFVQAPRDLGGLSACACYLTTSAKLPTNRLVQISELNETLSSTDCGLTHVHTLAIPTAAMLHQVLSTTFPSFAATKPGGRQIKLLIIDALGELFHSDNKTTTSTLVERSKYIVSISASLHELASQHKMAVVVLNEVVDTFDHPTLQLWDGKDLLYQYQSRWFNTAEFFGEGKKQASLGLAWANQVNTRIILSRTGKRRYLTEEDLPKRLRLIDGNSNHLQPSNRQVDEDRLQPTLIRRLSVIFSNVTSPISLEYIVTEKGICLLGDEEQAPWTADRVDNEHTMQVEEISAIEQPPPEPDTNVPLTSEGTTASIKQLHLGLEGDEFENSLWSTAESYENLDWDALEASLTQRTT
ncbi:hypothetical protein M413DRAFT_89112 [Hebeloma cylindrosporum]|uniref:RecA family profile 1 domain-containing protein n=1 Tax=Hebeloma cylindrosporum TaxID=76867 RepID=A0A0C2YGP9_HEBCY|nr:hypothetical protein M413DRAFT_89112 [Hebeloma cylindrosporum h7]